MRRGATGGTGRWASGPGAAGRGQQRRRLGAAPAAAVAFALLAAGCGAGPTFAGHGSPAAAGTPGAGGGPPSGTEALSACMRANGIPDFPDTTSGRMMMGIKNGAVSVNGVPLKESAAQFQAAQQACRQDIQAPSATSAATAQLQQQADAFAACMRAHGVANFPDPKVLRGGVRIQLPSGSANSPQFQSAQQACQSLSPIFGGAPAGAPPGGSA